MASLFDDDDDDVGVIGGLELGDEVTIHYTTKTLEGGVLERSSNREPFCFRLGDAAVVPGITVALLGKSVGDKVSIRLAPDNSFGHRRADWLVPVPLSELPEELSVGDQVIVHSAGAEFPAWVQKINANEALLDANHPLADETTLMEVDIVSAQPAQAEPSDQRSGKFSSQRHTGR